MICAYGFLSTLRDFFDICISNFWGEFVKFLSTWGRMLPRGRFSGHAVTGDFAGPCRRFGARVYPYTSRRCGAVQRPYMGPTMDTKNARLSAGAGIMFYLLRFAFWYPAAPARCRTTAFSALRTGFLLAAVASTASINMNAWPCCRLQCGGL